MGKGALKFGGKSGVLPSPREIFKQPYKAVQYQKPKHTGYANNIEHPKGTTRDYQPARHFTPQSRLSKSAHVPKRKYTPAELEKMPEAQKYRLKNSEMRRQFLSDSYRAEVGRLKSLQERQEAAKEEQRAADRINSHKEQSKAELFTMPTIETYLKGPLMQERTPEQKEAVRWKREANRLAQELSVKEHQAQQLLELYNASGQFAVTETKLAQMVEEAFSERKMQEVNKLGGLEPMTFEGMPSTMEFENTLRDTIMGKVNKGPSYEVVEDTLQGFTGEAYAEAEKQKEEKRQQLKEEATLKQKQMEELQSELENKAN